MAIRTFVDYLAEGYAAPDEAAAAAVAAFVAHCNEAIVGLSIVSTAYDAGGTSLVLGDRERTMVRVSSPTPSNVHSSPSVAITGGGSAGRAMPPPVAPAIPITGGLGG